MILQDLLVITAIPSIATIFSTAPLAFSSSFRPLEAFPISTEPAARDSKPAPEPVYSTVTVTPWFLSMKLSAIASQSFSIEVEPASLIVPFNSTDSTFFPCSASSALWGLSLPHPTSPNVIMLTAAIMAIILLFIIFFIPF